MANKIKSSIPVPRSQVEPDAGQKPAVGKKPDKPRTKGFAATHGDDGRAEQADLRGVEGGKLNAFVDPFQERNLPHRIVQSMVQKRLAPVLTRIVEGQKKRRGAAATAAQKELQELHKEVQGLDQGAFSDPDVAFSTVAGLTNRFDRLLDNADEATFGAIGVVNQLRALSVGLRLAYAGRKPEVRRQAFDIVPTALTIMETAAKNKNVEAELRELEQACAELDKKLAGEIGAATGLQPMLDGLGEKRQTYEDFAKLQAEVASRIGKPAEEVTPRMVWQYAEEHNLPASMLNDLLDGQLTDDLQAVASDQGLGKTRIARSLRGDAKRLAARVEELRAAPLDDSDRVENTVADLCRSLGRLLERAETLGPENQGPTSKKDERIEGLRSVHQRLDNLRNLTFGLRMSAELKNPEFRQRLQDGNDRLLELQQVSFDRDRLKEDLALVTSVEKDLKELKKDVADRLRVESVPPLDTALVFVSRLRKGLRVTQASSRSIDPAIKRAIDAIGDLEMDPAERGRLRAEVFEGNHLLDATQSLLSLTNELVDKEPILAGGRFIDSLLRAGAEDDDSLNPLLARSPLAFVGSTKFEEAAGDLHGFLGRADSPESRQRIDQVLMVLRAIEHAESENLDRIAFHVPEEHRRDVSIALGNYAVELATVVAQVSSGNAAEPVGEGLADFVELMLQSTNDRLDQLMEKKGTEIWTDEFAPAASGLRRDARAGAKSASKSQYDLLKADLEKNSPELVEQIEKMNNRLFEALEVVESTPDSREALGNILTDLSSVTRMISSMVVLFGAASNPDMPMEARKQTVKEAVERMGPLFVKMMQTLVNMESLLAQIDPRAKGVTDNPLIESMKALRDNVTPYPWPVMRRELEKALCFEEGKQVRQLDDLFAHIDEEPVGSGSIGQVHRARAKLANGQTADCVVKVQRPGVDQSFEDTVRVTELTLSIATEMLALDENGRALGPAKEYAERFLPMLERALGGFIESFRVETDFSIEVENQNQFAEMMAADTRIVIPKVLKEHTRNTVISMEEMKGFPLEDWLEHFEIAHAAPGCAEQRGPVGKGDRTEAEARFRQFTRENYGVDPESLAIEETVLPLGWTAKARVGAAKTELQMALHRRSGEISVRNTPGDPVPSALENRLKSWAERAFGLEPTGVELEPSIHGGRPGQRAFISFPDGRQKSAEVFVRTRDLEIVPVSLTPDLSERGIAELSKRLVATTAGQISNGLLHGDPHGGNLFVLPDGKTIGMIDFGLALDVGLADAKGPMRLLAAAYLQSPGKLAEAVLGVCDTDAKQTAAEREELVARLTDKFVAMFQRIDQRVMDELGIDPVATARTGSSNLGIGYFTKFVSEAMGEAVVDGVREEGLAPTPKNLQALKALCSMFGNIATLEEKVSEENRAGKSAALGGVLLYRAVAPFIGKKRAAAEGKRLAALANLDPATRPYARAVHAALDSVAAQPEEEES